MNSIGGEFKRVIRSRKISLAILSLLILCGYFIISGIEQYDNTIAKKSLFKKSEIKAQSKMLSYERYGNFGFRTFYEPSPTSVFFYNSNRSKRLECIINSLENSKITSIADGPSIFQDGVNNDIPGIIFLFGSMFVLWLGIDGLSALGSLKSIKWKQYWGAITIRFGVAFIATTFILSACFILVAFYGIGIRLALVSIILEYGIFAIVYLLFFYTLSLLIYAWRESRKEGLAYALIFWLILTIIAPKAWETYFYEKSLKLPSIEEIIEKKLNVLNKFEERSRILILELLNAGKRAEAVKLAGEIANKYLKVELSDILKVEDDYIRQIDELIHESESGYSFIPTIAYLTITKEASSLGRRGYRDYLIFLKELKQKFLHFYVEKRYFSSDKTVESFIEDEEHIFKAKPSLPSTYWASTIVTFLISIVFLGAAVMIIRRRQEKEQTEKPNFKVSEGGMNFIWCKDEENRDRLYNHYRNQPGAICIDNVDGEDIDPGIPPEHALTYFCKKMGARTDLAQGHLKRLGVTFPVNFKNEKKKKKARALLMKKIYLAACLAQKGKLIIVNDFVLQESPTFERYFLDLIKSEIDMEKTLIYLSTELYRNSELTDIKAKRDEDEKFVSFYIREPLKINLR